MVFARVVTRCALALDLDPHASGGRLELEVVTQVQRQAQGVEPRSEVRRGRRDPDRCPGALVPRSPMAWAAAAMSASLTVGVMSWWDRAVALSVSALPVDGMGIEDTSCAVPRYAGLRPSASPAVTR